MDRPDPGPRSLACRSGRAFGCLQLLSPVSLAMPRRRARAARLLLPFVLVAAISAAATPAAGCAAAAPLRALCSCGGVGSVGRAMESAALVAIAVPDSTAPGSAVGDARSWPLRIERAWKWPGGGAAPPRQVVVATRSNVNACSIEISPGERQLVVAWVRPAGGVLILGHKCATPWGAVDTLGPTATDIRRYAGDAAVRGFARDQARLLDSLSTYGPGTTPAP